MAKYTAMVTQRYIDGIGNEITLYPKTVLSQVEGMEEYIVATTVTIPATGWVDSMQTVPVTGVTDSNHIIVSPDPDSFIAYTGHIVRCIAQGNGTLTFKCEAIPDLPLTVNVLIN